MKQPISVLVVEDSDDDYYLLGDILKSSPEVDAGVLRADRLQKALSMPKLVNVDVAVLDLFLPDSFGLETFVSFHKQYPAIPTIIMTGSRDNEMAVEAVRQGAQDYLFKGEPSATAIVRTLRYAIERHRLRTELRQARDHIDQLRGMLPICSECKKIRDDRGYWNRIESYLSQHSDVKFSHGICPDCAKKLYPELTSHTETQ